MRLIRQDLITRRSTGVGPLVTLRAFAGDGFEVLMKAGEIIKTAFEAQMFNTQVRFNQQFTSVPDPNFRQKPGIRFSGT